MSDKDGQVAKSEIPGLSRTEFLVMNLLMSARAEMYGLQLVEESDGALKRGTVYVTLMRLEDKGYIASRREAETIGGASARRLYKATGLGQQVYRALAGIQPQVRLQRVLAT